MRKDTQAVLLLLLGAMLVKISFGGTYVRYVKPALLPLLLGAAAALIALAAVTLWQVLRSGVVSRSGPHHGPQHSEPGRHAEGSRHGHDRHGDDRHGDDRHVEPVARASTGDEPAALETSEQTHLWVGWLLIVPALALLLFAPPAVGSYQAGRSGTALAFRVESGVAPLPEGDPVRLTLLDYGARAAFDQGRSLTGRRITLVGFVLAGPQGRPYLARMFVGCCAADALPVKIGLAGDVPTDLTEDQWIEVVGTYAERTDRDPVNREIIPYFQVAELRYIEPPEQQYE